MNQAKFETQELLDKDGKPQSVEFIRIKSGLDEVVREATDEDRERYKQAYRAFKAPAYALKPEEPSAVEPPPEFMPGFAEEPPATEPEEHHEKE